jgi:hypothetical protein
MHKLWWTGGQRPQRRPDGLPLNEELPQLVGEASAIAEDVEDVHINAQQLNGNQTLASGAPSSASNI